MKSYDRPGAAGHSRVDLFLFYWESALSPDFVYPYFLWAELKALEKLISR